MRGLDPQLYQHQIHLRTDAKPVAQKCYRMNPNYPAKIKEEIGKLLRVGFIRPVKQATWLSSIVVVLKKNGEIRVCVDYSKLNVVTVTDVFPLPFTDGVLHAVAGHEVYNFLDIFHSYNQIRMHPEDQEKKAFVTEWGVFVAVVMMFRLKTVSATFQRIIIEFFGKYIPAFMQVFLDDFVVYSKQEEHLDHLRMCLKKCREYRLSLNPGKCVFGVTSGTLLGHIVSKGGIAVDPNKVRAILEAPVPNYAKALSRFLGQLSWHSRMLRHLVDFATPLHVTVHRLPFQWAEKEDKAYQALKVMLSQALGVQPPNWTKSFHVFIDTSDIATHRTEVVPASVLCKSETLKSRAKLLHNGKRGSRDGVQRHQVPSLLVRTQVFVSHGPIITNLPGFQDVVNRQNNTVDTPITGV